MATVQGTISGDTGVMGIEVDFPTASPLWNKEIQRAEGDGSGGPVAGTPVIIDTIPAEQETYRDVGAIEPLDSSKTYIYRYRLTRVGAADGTWSDWSKEMKPTLLSGAARAAPAGEQVQPQVSGDVEVDQTVPEMQADFNIRDPQQRLTALEFVTKTGAGPFGTSWASGWDRTTGTIGSDTSLERGENVGLQNAHIAGVKLRYQWEDQQGNTRSDFFALFGDLNEQANVYNFSVAVSSAGNVLTTGSRDDDGVTTYITVSTSGSAPADPDGAGNEDVSTTDAAWSDLDTTVDANPGDTVIAKARAEDSNGNLGPVETYRIGTVANPDLAQKLRADIGSPTGQTASTVTFSLDAVNGPSTVGPVEVQLESRNVDDSDGWTVEQSWVGSLPHSESVTKFDSQIKELRLLVRDTGANNARGLTDRTVIPPRLGNFGKFKEGSGDLSTSILHGSGFPVQRHNEEAKGRNEDGSVSFSQTYDTAPVSIVQPSDGSRIFSSSDSGSDQRLRMKTSGLDTAGFDDLIAEIITGVSTTSINDGFSSSQNASAPEDNDVSLTSESDRAFSNLEDANGTATDYTVFFDVDTNSMTLGESVTVHIDVNDGATSTNWSEVASNTYPANATISDAKLTFNTSLGTDYDIRARITYSGTTSGATITMHGEDNTEPGVQYERDDGSTTVSMTPNTGDKVLWRTKDVS